ncbi:hypothetical protein Tco_1252312 [Tanacetum coccineum]
MFNGRVDIKDHSFSPNFEIELFLFNSNHCISSVKKGSSQDERNFAILFRFENNKVSREGLRVSRDSLAYKEYDIRLMLAPRSTRALQEKVLLKLHGIRKLLGSSSLGETLFWIIVELSSLKKSAEICSILCLLLISSLRNFPLLGILSKTSTRGHNFVSIKFTRAFSGESDSFPKGWFRFLVFHPVGFEQDLVFEELAMIKDFDDIAFGHIMAMAILEHFLHTKPSIGIVIAGPGVGATTRSTAHMGSSSIGL